MTIGGKGFSMQQFTSSGSWTAPAGVSKVMLIGMGGGGGGAGGSKGTFLGFAFGGQGTVPEVTYITVVPNTSYTINVGAGGAAGLARNTNGESLPGGNGGTTSFGTLANFYGAIGGGDLSYYFSTQQYNTQAAINYPSALTIMPAGGAFGQSGDRGSDDGLPFGGGGGGSGYSGVGGFGGNASATGTASPGFTGGAGNYGSGGGGGGATDTGPASGGGAAGIDGMLWVIWTEG